LEADSSIALSALPRFPDPYLGLADSA